ncbi:MAG: alpha-glucan family phosphorylase [Candidatus Altiarchaeales archaeon HGW-Altiarchaeales-3]|nr:MAG: alpha-glucan family phosphorylase [Candidatus Altiarchaeales archaeon HGW-Altiarchaeales-3]
MTKKQTTSEDKEKNIPRKIAYFSMEIAANFSIPNYSGGLGVLSGDTIKSFADLKVPAVAVTLLYKKGFFYQKLDRHGNQQELPVEWDPEKYLKLLPQKVTVKIENKPVVIQAWQYDVAGVTGYTVPILFLDSDLEENDKTHRGFTDHLYGGDERYRLAQEIILGIGGVRMLKELDHLQIKKYHMNEGHSGLLTLELLKNTQDSDAVRELCVFTTHTPVAAGHDSFSYDLVNDVLGDFVPMDVLKRHAGENRLNMTLLALNLSKYINGVAKKHGEVSRKMFPDYQINSITNGVHSYTWTGESFRKLYDQHIPDWKHDNFCLRHASRIPKHEIWEAHIKAKKKLIDYVNENNINEDNLNENKDAKFDPKVFTIGFARRVTAYKRFDFIFSDIYRLASISRNVGKIQIVFAGKAHFRDGHGRDMIKKMFNYFQQINPDIKAVFLENYNAELGQLITSGVDLWLNTPQKPNEASGTSGMKAAHNGVPSLSTLDGWWIEGCIDGVTGWAIESDASTIRDESLDMYNRLEYIIIPMFYKNRGKWIDVMQQSISVNASYFNTQRMVMEYVLNAYLC